MGLLNQAKRRARIESGKRVAATNLAHGLSRQLTILRHQLTKIAQQTTTSVNDDNDGGTNNSAATTTQKLLDVRACVRACVCASERACVRVSVLWIDICRTNHPHRGA